MIISGRMRRGQALTLLPPLLLQVRHYLRLDILYLHQLLLHLPIKNCLLAFKKTNQDSKVLEAALPTTSVQAINGWIRTRLNEPAKRERHGQLVKQIQDIIKDAPPGVLPDQGSMLAEWGLTLDQATSVVRSEAYQDQPSQS